ncbi:MAG: acyl-CoA carboxylase subunit epsilon [Geodermatophilaceae bacterium]|nr:acyl-CoA carboxylase subunit epsilon [Geodermatophilaceae bacterium]
MSNGEAGGARDRPVLRVVRGEPTDDELAALLVVVLTRTEPEAQRRAAPGWADRTRALRRPQRPGAGAWRTSALP